MTLELTTISSLRDAVRQWRTAGESVALVPTMGALHAGHRALIDAARAHARRVVVSIFVNPTQFGPHEDFARYPRPLGKDLALLSDARVDAAWLPSVETMYPQGFATTLHVAGMGGDMEGAIRPGHFDGVATVVTKLLLQVAPDIVAFGEKDYQQLCLIKRLVNDLNINISVLEVPTVRESDGLAMSSRNQYLNAQERAIAPMLYAELNALAVQLALSKSGAMQPLLEQAKTNILAAGFAQVDYLELRDRDTLAPVITLNAPARLLVAARLGATRLIDNIGV